MNRTIWVIFQCESRAWFDPRAVRSPGPFTELPGWWENSQDVARLLVGSSKLIPELIGWWTWCIPPGERAILRGTKSFWSHDIWMYPSDEAVKTTPIEGWRVCIVAIIVVICYTYYNFHYDDLQAFIVVHYMTFFFRCQTCRNNPQKTPADVLRYKASARIEAGRAMSHWLACFVIGVLQTMRKFIHGTCTFALCDDIHYHWWPSGVDRSHRNLPTISNSWVLFCAFSTWI